jgi:SAM-dependent methyltransferase
MAPSNPSTRRFSHDAVDVEDYDRYRPDYAAGAVAWFVGAAGLGPGDRVVDVAAGTGKLTRGLVDAGLDVVAVEPGPAMRQRLASRLPGVRVVAAMAERLPLATATVTAIAIAHGFHLFDVEPALAELGRLVRPGGTLAVFSNVYASHDPVNAAVDAVIDRFLPAGKASSAVFGVWRDALTASGAFEPSGFRSFDHPHAILSDKIAALVATSSDVAALPEVAHRELLGEIEAMSARLPPQVTIAAETQVELFSRT